MVDITETKTEMILPDDIKENVLNEKGFLNIINGKMDIQTVDIRTYNPLNLAFVGDCVFELIIRSILVEKGNKSVNSLAKDKNKIVNARSQSRIAEFLKDYYTDEEADVYRRGKNAKTANHSKSAAYSEYHKATGLEAVCGYLYLTGRTERCMELIKTALDNLEFN